MKDKIISLSIFSVFLLFVYRSLIFNIGTNLPDWLDYAYINWLISISVDKIITFNFSTLFNTNAFYPNQYSYFFSDTLLPQAIIATPFYLLFKNYILAFNLTLLLTLFLDYFSAYLFWKQIFKNNFIAIFGGLLIFFSPFFHLENGHFQMLSYWPFFFTLFYVFKYEKSQQIRHIVIAALFFSIQFLASVYLFIFLLFTLGLYFLFSIIKEGSKTRILKQCLIFTVIFISIDGIFIKGYADMKNAYQFKREFSEYITYSANLSDYIFTNRINSIVHKSPILQKWNSFDKNNLGGTAQFPGFLLFTLGIIGLIKIIYVKKSFDFILKITPENAFYLSLIIIGFTFSLGPRIMFNGTYSHIPAPYALPLKILPFLESIRVVARWSFLFYFGLIYFALLTLNKLQNKYDQNLTYFIFIFILIIEYVPLNITTHTEEINNDQYAILAKICSSNKKVLLEIPVTHLDVYPGIGEGVNYISKVELSSIYHHCYLANGYSGYDLPSIFKLRDTLYQLLQNYDSKGFIEEVKRNQIDIIKFNPENVIKELREPVSYMIKELGTEKGVKQISNTMFLIDANPLQQ